MLLHARHRFSWLFRRAPADLPFFLLAVQTAVALAVSPLPARSIAAVWPHALGLALYYLVARLPWTPQRLVWAQAGLGLLSIGLATLGVGGMDGVRLPVWTPSILSAFRERFGAAFNPNVVAGYLALLTPIVLGLLIAPRPSVLLRLLYAVATGAGAAVLVLSESRAGLAAGAIGSLGVLALRWPKVVLPLAGVGAAVALVRMPGLSLGTLGQALTAGAGSVSGMDGRVEIWQRAVYILQDFSFTGLGFGCFEPVVEVMYPLFLSANGTQPHAHNLVLQVGVDLGLPGLIAFTSLAGVTAYLLIGAARSRGCRRASESGTMAIALCCGFASVALHGVLDAAVWGNKGAFIPWAVAALAVPLFEQRRARDAGGVANA